MFAYACNQGMQIMNWQDHKQLYRPMNMAKLLFEATQEWKDRVLVQHFDTNESQVPPKLELIDGGKE